MMNALDLLFEIGDWSIYGLWIPLTVWTTFALPVFLIMRFAEGIPADIRYRGVLALVASLPLGVMAAWLGPFDAWEAGQVAVMTLPPLAYAAPAPSAEPEFAWTLYHSAGMATVVFGLLAVWKTVALALALAALRLYRARAVQPAPARLTAAVHRTAEGLGFRGRVEAAVAADRGAPLTFGWIRPLIVVPARLLDADDDLELAIAHELTHIRRHDYLVQLTEQLIGALFFAHPLVALLRRESAVLREITCDADVLARTGDAPRYARLLFRYSTATDARWSMAVGITLREHHLKKRIRAMKQFLDLKSLSRSRRIGLTAAVSVFVLALAAVACSDAIVNPTANEGDRSVAAVETFVIVEQMPELIGGLESIQKNLVYPKPAKDAGVEGRVIVQFVVDEEGNVTDPRVVRGIGSGLDEAALEAVQTARFRPGMQRGEAVRVKMSLPVTFRLGSDPQSESAPPPPLPDEGAAGPPTPDAETPPPPPPPSPTSDPLASDDGVFEVVDQMPELEGGLASILGDLKYPEIARRAGIEGRVIVRFVVDTNGDVRDARIVRGIGGGADEEALRVVQNARFTPGMHDGNPVNVRMTLPITFKLPTEEAASLIRIHIDADGNVFLNGRRVGRENLIREMRLAGLSAATIVQVRVNADADEGVVSAVQERIREAGAQTVEYSTTP